MKTIRLILAGAVGAGMLIITGAGPALACSCALSHTRDFVGIADVIVSGTLTDIQPPAERAVMSSGDPVTYTVAVHRTFKGVADEQLTFVSAVSGASCGLEGMTADRRYMFFLNEGDATLTATLCGGTRPLGDDLAGQVARWTGPPVVTTAQNGPEAAPASTTTDSDEPASSVVGLPAWLFVALGAVAIGSAALFIALIRRRRSADY